jgi:hypothetical protein
MRAHTLLLLLACSAAVGLQNSAASRSGAKPKQAYPAGVSHRIPSGPILAADQRAHYSLQAGVDCATCTAFATLAQDIAENATELADIVAALDVVCKDLSPNDNTTYALCAAVVKDAMNILPWVNTQLTMLAWDIPLGFCSVFVPVCQNPCCNTTTVPEQLHIALTNDASQMSVTWVTLQNTNTSTVQWGPAANASGVFPHSANGWTKTYTDGGWVGVLHVAVMTNLSAGTTYSYRVGDANGGWSKVFNFTTFASNIGSTERPFRIAQIGDEAYDNNSDVTVATMTQLVADGELDMVLHIGDIGYADGQNFLPFCQITHMNNLKFHVLQAFNPTGTCSSKRCRTLLPACPTWLYQGTMSSGSTLVRINTDLRCRITTLRTACTTASQLEMHTLSCLIRRHGSTLRMWTLPK